VPRGGGILALAGWQIDAGDPHHARIVPWEEWNQRAPEPIDPAALEPGDCLLAWGAARDSVAAATSRTQPNSRS